jgi:hypothetical protein
MERFVFSCDDVDHVLEGDPHHHLTTVSSFLDILMALSPAKVYG